MKAMLYLAAVGSKIYISFRYTDLHAKTLVKDRLIVRRKFMRLRSITGTPSEILVEQLVASDVKYLFYNSGSREALFFDALHRNPNIQGILGLHEGTVTAMAGSYSQVDNEPAVMLVHLGAGLAQCMGQLINVWYGGLPVVVITFYGDTGSWTDRINLDLDHSYGPTSISAPMTKATWTVIDPEGLPSAVERALRVARTPPFGPVHLAVYDRLLENRQVTTDIIEDTDIGIRTGIALDSELEEIVEALDAAERPLIFAGDGIWKSGADRLAENLATHFGTGVTTTAYVEHRGISIKHPQHMGGFELASQSYDPDLILSIGVRHRGAGKPTDYAGFRRLWERSGKHIALGSDMDYISHYPGIHLGIIADERDALSRLLSIAGNEYPSSKYDGRRKEALSVAADWRNGRREAMLPDPVKGKVRPGILIDAVDDALEAIGGGIVTNEQFAASHEALNPGLSENMNTYLRAGGGSEGWGVGAAIGAKLAAGDTPVVGFVGDGSLYYADSGLWTSVHHNIPVLYIITNNGAYGIVAGFYGRAGGSMSDTGKYGGVVLDGIDPLKIANAFGMDGESIDDEDKVQEAVERGLKIVTEENRPYLLEFKLPIGLPEGGIADKQYRMK